MELMPVSPGNVNGGLSTGALCSFNPKTGAIDGPKIDCP